MKTSLGKLEKVELRDVWESESSDFTPWLAKDENIKVLGEEIGRHKGLKSLGIKFFSAL